MKRAYNMQSQVRDHLHKHSASLALYPTKTFTGLRFISQDSKTHRLDTSAAREVVGETCDKHLPVCQRCMQLTSSLKQQAILLRHRKDNKTVARASDAKSP
ncbi:unnamed protein product [Polarella glacialis]|uniref:Uncharacterized protein n=1 Tax=Polarella glacialis TaxID=89957 RepID=A0A813HLE5_POLGL|nr:unnamed protein product [Polarella glacialis]